MKLGRGVHLIVKGPWYALLWTPNVNLDMLMPFLRPDYFSNAFLPILMSNYAFTRLICSSDRMFFCGCKSEFIETWVTLCRRNSNHSVENILLCSFVLVIFGATPSSENIHNCTHHMVTGMDTPCDSLNVFFCFFFENAFQTENVLYERKPEVPQLPDACLS